MNADDTDMNWECQNLKVGPDLKPVNVFWSLDDLAIDNR